jgi:hypothetical protein
MPSQLLGRSPLEPIPLHGISKRWASDSSFVLNAPSPPRRAHHLAALATLEPLARGRPTGGDGPLPEVPGTPANGVT